MATFTVTVACATNVYANCFCLVSGTTGNNLDCQTLCDSYNSGLCSTTTTTSTTSTTTTTVGFSFTVKYKIESNISNDIISMPASFVNVPSTGGWTNYEYGIILFTGAFQPSYIFYPSTIVTNTGIFVTTTYFIPGITSMNISFMNVGFLEGRPINPPPAQGVKLVCKKNGTTFATVPPSGSYSFGGRYIGNAVTGITGNSSLTQGDVLEIIWMLG